MDLITLALAKKQIGQGIPEAVSDYLDEHLTNPTDPPIDTSLSIAGAAADAKKTGDELSDLKEGLSDFGLIAYYTESDFEKMSGGRIDKTTGQVVADNSYKYTPLIALSSGDYVECAVYSASSNLGIVVYSDAEHTTVIYSKYGCRPTTPIKYVAKDTCYVRLSCSNEYISTAYARIYGGAVMELHTKTLDKVNTLALDYSEIAWNDGYINYQTGASSTIASGKCTDYIKVAKGEKITLGNYYPATISDLRGLAFYDANKAFYSGQQMTGADIEVIVPVDGYIRFSAHVDAYTSMMFAVDFSALFASVNTKVEIDGTDQVSKKNAIFYNHETTSNNVLNVADGIYQDAAKTWQIVADDNVFTVERLVRLSSDVNIPVMYEFTPDADTTFAMSIYCNDTYVSANWDKPILFVILEDGVLFKNIEIGSINYGRQTTFTATSGKTYSVGVRVKNRSQANAFFDAGNTMTFTANLQLSANATSTYEKPATLYIKDVYELLNKMDGVNGDVTKLSNPLSVNAVNGGLTNIFSKIACIGDSLTRGGMTLPNVPSSIIDFDQFSYPSQLARLLGNTVYNMGLSGATATTDGEHSWNTYATEQGYFTDQYKAQAYIIALGVNDNSHNGSFDGDVSTDIDTSDYTNNADTSVGGYARVIQRIKELVPDAIIFCVTIPNTQNGNAQRAAANIKIKAVAELFDCFVIDLETYGVGIHDVSGWKATYYCGTHCNAMGYRWLAETMATYINWIIQHNPSDFYLVPAIQV